MDSEQDGETCEREANCAAVAPTAERLDQMQHTDRVFFIMGRVHQGLLFEMLQAILLVGRQNCTPPMALMH
jgi:hypothetical protein